MNDIWKKLLPWVLAIVTFLVLSIAYFSPLIEGKRLQQGDIIHFKGGAKEIEDFRAKHGTEPLWTNSMFGGMPAYQISTKYPSNLTRIPDQILQLGLPRPANYLFLYALGFFILLMVLRVNPWLAVAGSIGFAFSSYFFIILEAGHNSKAHAIAYMAPVIAGIILTFRRKYLLGGALTALFLALQIGANHLQITYYMGFIILFLSLAYLVQFIREKQYLPYLKAAAVILVAALVAVGPNIGNLLTTYEYSKYTIRGPSELTHDQKNKTSGLDKDYATDWSYGVSETMTLLIPNFKGGSSNGPVGKNTDIYRALEQNNVPNATDIIKSVPTYWGPQPFTSGPVYVGAIMLFLCLLGLILVKGPLKWAMLAATILSITLAWGRHFPLFTDFFLNYVPMYNKFRAVTMILVIAEFTIPLLGILAVNEFFNEKTDKKLKLNALKTAFFITGGIALFFALFSGGLFDFVSTGDAKLRSNPNIPAWFVDSLPGTRLQILRQDAFRSLLFIILSAALLWTSLKYKIKREYIFTGLILLILIDMWPVNHRFLNKDNFVRKSQMENPYEASQADLNILQDTDPDYRVLNTAVSTFNDASTSYFHKSIGGYHGAKLRRYQELFEQQIANNNRGVINMLNTKYFIGEDENRAPVAQRNPEALGNAWFVTEVKMVPNADAEMAALSQFDPSKTAIVDQRFSQYVKGFTSQKDSLDQIRLTSYQANKLEYEYQASSPQLAVFSEIYYDKGWKATIDGQPAPHFRANYVLRAMIVPQGKHKIVFDFHPDTYYKGEKIALASSILLFLLVAGLLGWEIRKYFRKPAPAKA